MKIEQEKIRQEELELENSQAPSGISSLAKALLQARKRKQEQEQQVIDSLEKDNKAINNLLAKYLME